MVLVQNNKVAQNGKNDRTGNRKSTGISSKASCSKCRALGRGVLASVQNKGFLAPNWG